jgi:hypothetical protein
VAFFLPRSKKATRAREKENERRERQQLMELFGLALLA